MNDELMRRKASLTSDPHDDAEGKMSIGLMISAFVAGWRLVATICFATMLLGLLYVVFLNTPVYEASAVVGPVSNSFSLGSSGAAALAGLGNGNLGRGQADFKKFLQVVQSNRLAARLERNHGVLEAIFPGWDPQTKSWNSGSGPIGAMKRAIRSALGLPASKAPQPANLADFLSKHLILKSVGTGDSLLNQSQIYQVTLDLPYFGYTGDLLRYILTDSDTLVREDQLYDTSRRIAFLTKALDETNEVALRESLQSIMIDQERTLMSLKADRYYAFDMIDEPSVDPVPKGAPAPILLILSMFAGLVAAGLVIYVIVARRVGEESPDRSDPLRRPFPDPIGRLLSRRRARPQPGERKVPASMS